MFELVKSQMDYLIFLEGLVFLAVGVVCFFILLRGKNQPFAWQYLGLFGILHGSGEWFSLVALSMDGIASLTWIRLTFVALGGFALLEFARQGSRGRPNRSLGRWILLPFVISFVMGRVLGTTLPGLILQLIPFALGSFWSAYILAGHYLEDETQYRPLTLLGLALAAHGGIDVGVLLQSNNPINLTGSVLLANRDIMVAAQMTANLVAACALFAVIEYSAKQHRFREMPVLEQPTRWQRQLFLNGIISVLLLVFGWGLTQQAGKLAEREQTQMFLERATTAAAAISPERVKALTGTSADIGFPTYQQIQSKLRTFLDAGPDARFVYLLGRKQDQIVFLVDAERVGSKEFSPPGSVYPQASARLKQAFDDGMPFLEGPITDEGGTWFSAHAPVFDERGNVLALIGIDIDAEKWPVKFVFYRLVAISISLILFLSFLFIVGMYLNRKLALASVASEQRFRTVFDYASESIIIFDRDSQRIVHLNHFAQHKLGYGPEEIISLTVEDIFVGSGLEVVNEIVGEESVLSDRVWEGKCCTKSGQMIDVQITGAQIQLQDRACIVIFSRDITSQKIVEEALRIRTKALESAANSIAITNQKGRILYVNPAYSRLTGHSIAEVFDRTLSFLNPEMVDEEKCRLLWETARAGKVWRGEMVDRRKDGTLYPAEITLTPVLSAGGEITHFVAMIQDITDRKKAEEQLKYLATHDALTGIPNRFYLEDVLKMAVAKAKRGKSSALLLADLDNFKLVNDTLGHAAGDQVLINLVQVFRSKLREEDFLARLGGDEFAVLLDSIPAEGAFVVAEKLRRAVFEGEGPLREYSSRFNLSLSGGLIIIDGGMDSVRLLSQADSGLYASKETGRNRITFVDSAGDALEQLNEKNRLLTLIKNAVADESLVQMYRPVFDLKENRIAYFEAQVHLTGNKGESFSSETFIPLAERYGLISDINFWTVCAALEMLKKFPEICIYIKVSGISIADKAFVQKTERTLRESSISPDRLGFELNETTAVRDPARAEQRVRTIKRIGCRLALDHFGLQCSSFSHLQNLPLDLLKIDRTFVEKLSEGSYISLVKAMNAVAHTLGMKTVAESVETNQTLQILRELETDFAQGSLVGNPSPVPDVPIQLP